MSLFAAACLVFVLLCMARQVMTTGLSSRIMLTAPFLAALAILVSVPFAELFLPPRIGTSARRRLHAVSMMESALALTGLAAAAGLTIVAMLALYPPPLEHSGYKAWEYLDKRWLVASYLLVAGLLHLPGLARRVLLGAAASDRTLVSRGRGNALPRALVAGAIGCILAVLYVAPLLPATVDRYLDMHDQVHLGAFQRIAHGAEPYLDARTQYGPGHQIATYAMMRASDFSLRGFRLSQAWLNLIAIAALLSLWFFAFGWRIGAAIAVASLAVSPLIITTFWGWGLVLRWMAPVLVGAIFPLLLWRRRSRPVTVTVVVALGVACGGLAWMAQENFSGAIMAALLIVSTAFVRGAITLRTALIVAVSFIAVESATFLAFMVASFGLGGLAQSLHLYFLSTGLVFQGMTNTDWSEPQSTFRRAYPVTPILIYLVSAIALYLTRRRSLPDDEFHIAQIAGMAAAAVPLTMLTLFRADTPHFVGASTALVPLLILIFVYLPGRLDLRIGWPNAIRVALVGFYLLVYYNPVGNYRMRLSNDRTFSDPRSIGRPASIAKGLELLRQGVTRRPSGHADIVERQFGFAPPAGAPCCHNAEWTFGQFTDTMRRLHDSTAGRSVFVDVAPPLESSGIYFLADLAPATPYVSRIMSLWTDDDIRVVTADLLKRPPGCIVSGPSGTLATAALLKAYPSYKPRRIPGPLRLSVSCRPPPGEAQHPASAPLPMTAAG